MKEVVLDVLVRGGPVFYILNDVRTVVTVILSDDSLVDEDY